MTRAWRCAWLIWLAGIEGAGYDWVIPFAVFLISTSAPSATEWLRSVTTPVNPPEVLVWACNSVERQI